MPLSQCIKHQANKGSFSFSPPLTQTSKVLPPLGNSSCATRIHLSVGYSKARGMLLSQAKCHSPGPLSTPPSCPPVVLTWERPGCSVSNRWGLAAQRAFTSSIRSHAGFLSCCLPSMLNRCKAHIEVSKWMAPLLTQPIHLPSLSQTQKANENREKK